MILIFCELATPRLLYILDELFMRRMGLGYRITNDVKELETFRGPCLNYSTIKAEKTIQIIPVSLLSETGIQPGPIHTSDEKWWQKVFFRTAGDIPFDLFSAAFYLLSRYEEYLPHEEDQHGRYLYYGSLAYRDQFLELPLVDIWVQQLKWQLWNRFGIQDHPVHKFRFLSTVDIDFAYKFRGIGFSRGIKKFGKALLEGRLADCLSQLKVLTGSGKDPYDTYDLIHEICDENDIDLLYFILLKSGNEYDKNIPATGADMLNLIRKITNHGEIGLHPSYSSVTNKQELKLQLELLEKLTGKKVITARQHFLRIFIPGTYRQLSEAGIENDYSMCYPEIAGFRASTSMPFLFFDLTLNLQTGLMLHPVCVMDVTLKNYMKLDPFEAMKKIEQLLNEVKKTGGTFISIWHNSNMTENEGWEGWREVFEKMHTLASSKQKKEID